MDVNLAGETPARTEGYVKNTIADRVRRTELRHPTKPPDPLGVLTKGQHISSVQILDGLNIYLAGEIPAKTGICASLVSHQLKTGRITGVHFR